MGGTKNITRTNLLCWIITIFLISGVLTAFFIYQKVLDFEEQAEQLKIDFNQYKKGLLASEARNVCKFLDYQYAKQQRPKTVNQPQNRGELEKVQAQALEILKGSKFGVDSAGNISIYDRSGKCLLAPGGKSAQTGQLTKINTSQGETGFNTLLRKTRKLDNGMIFYQVPEDNGKSPLRKLTCWRYFTPWGWLVSASMNVDDVGVALEAAENRLQSNLVVEIIYLLVLALLVTCAALVLSFSISSRIRKELNLLIDYLKETPNTDARLPRDIFVFNEFRFIADSTVNMMKKIQDLIGKLKRMAVHAESANRAKTGFLASISHELRIPMTGVMGMAQILRDTALDPDQKKFVKTILSSGDSLVQVVEEISDFSAIDSGEELVLMPRPFDLPKNAGTVVEYFEEKIDAKKLELNLNIDPETPKYLNGDAARIMQTLNILINNAIMFTDEGRIDVNISCISEADDGKMADIKFEVADTGLGISEGKLKNIFNFANEDVMDKSRKFAGVTLGLAVCKSLVDIMGGNISASSVKGEGSAFTFMLPLEISDAANVRHAESELLDTLDHKVEKLAKTVKVLLAEDDPVNRSVAETFLKRLGCEVDSVMNGKLAVDKFKTKKYDIVFLDCEMPEMDGYAATRAIREIEPGDTRIPIIAMTAYAMQKDKEQSIEAGMDYHISKPVAESTLAQIIAKFVKK